MDKALAGKEDKTSTTNVARKIKDNIAGITKDNIADTIKVKLPRGKIIEKCGGRTKQRVGKI